MKPDKFEEMFLNIFKTILLIFGLILIPVGLFLYLRLKKDNFFLKRFDLKQQKNLLIDSSILLTISLFPSYYLYSSLGGYSFLISLPAIWYFGFAVSLFVLPKILKDKLFYRIGPTYLKNKIKNFDDLEKDLLDPNYSPLGKSLTTFKPVYLNSLVRNEHIMITGSPGSGKSSTAITMRKSDYIQGRPVIDIDPKGSNEDITVMKKYAELYDRKDDFYHFNISDPENSWGYNPLEIGSKRSKIDKIIYALELNHEHYSGIAVDILSLIFDTCELINKELCIADLSRLLISKEELFQLFERVHDLPSSDLKEDLLLRITSTKGLKSEDIRGLKSKINALSSSELQSILNPKGSKRINLTEVISGKKIAYFQLNTMEYKGLNKTLARFILSDLQIVASQISSGTIDLKTDFVAVYVDEAASFIDETFPDYLRMVRDARISLTFIFQSMAGLDLLFGDSFKHELISNTRYSIHFEAASSVDSETITLIPGTIKSRQRSFAVNSENISDYNGRGTEKVIEEKKIDSNTLRSLNKNQCLFFDKANKYYDLVEIWHGKKALNSAKTKSDLTTFKTLGPLNEPIKAVQLIQQDILLSHLNPKNWHQALNYSEIDQARSLRISWIKTK